MSRDSIFISDIMVECVVGVYPEERTRTQPLRVDLSLEVDTSLAGRTGRLLDAVDYARVTEEVSTVLKFREYRLLETAAEELCAMLLSLHPAAVSVQLTIEKPEALVGRARSAGVRVDRSNDDYPRRWEHPDFGEVEVVYESSEAGLYLLHVEPGRQIPPHHHEVMRELEWVARGELHRDGKLIKAFSPMAWPQGRTHCYENNSGARATVFCCDTPPFIPQDEISDGGQS
jgi:dihydroneopterin aldolase